MPHISWSQIKMLQRCGMQYEFRYVEGKKIPPGVAAHIGSSTHQSIEKNLKYRIEQGELLPLDVVQDIARDALLTNWEMRGVLLLPEEKSKGIKQVKGEAIDQAVALSRLHRVKAAPKIKPVSVEREWELDIKDAGWSIKGRIDIETPRAEKCPLMWRWIIWSRRKSRSLSRREASGEKRIFRHCLIESRRQSRLSRRGYSFQRMRITGCAVRDGAGIIRYALMRGGKQECLVSNASYFC